MWNVEMLITIFYSFVFAFETEIWSLAHKNPENVILRNSFVEFLETFVMEICFFSKILSRSIIVYQELTVLKDGPSWEMTQHWLTQSQSYLAPPEIEIRDWITRKL